MHTQSISFGRLASAAWPGLHVREVDGWLLRSAGGVTNRANSVLAEGEPADVEAALAEVERHYARLGQPSVFQVSPDSRPADLDELLAARGYRVVSPVHGQTAAIPEALAALGEQTRHPVVTGEPTESWLDLYWAQNGQTDPASRFITQQILAAVPGGYAELDGQALVRGALVRDWVGIFGMWVDPAARGKGLARAVLAGLLRWAADRGATHAFLQVMVDNTVAQRLYASAGFSTVSSYHYRVLDRP
ncbi:GNAT family N-acetyltransferase [Crossiella sp. CA-258035]|uniref:GNAT family N-acetyltransferase n=1 Tax=Crossiella sp. CA-258035 TaxID=2981138 RepID=UPI0024BC6E0A|nr:GNAT family N-acetyltransferase [Crossiella sp. CA-258035]WHT20079.1 GNAT family N-acetyltransferase [Crossiella sp. CA-258035]